MTTVTAVGVGMIMGIGAVLVTVLLPRGDPGPAGLLGRPPVQALSWLAVGMAAASTAAAAALLAAGQPAAGLAAASFGGLGVLLIDAQRREPPARPVRPRGSWRLPDDGGGFWLFVLLLLGDS